MINNEYELHPELPPEFKVKLCGSDYPPKFQEGDRLTIDNNTNLQCCRYILLKLQGGHKVLTFQEFSHGPYTRSDVIGGILSYERSCFDDYELYVGMHTNVGSYFNRYIAPKMCKDCDREQILEGWSNLAMVCCFTSWG